MIANPPTQRLWISFVTLNLPLPHFASPHILGRVLRLSLYNNPTADNRHNSTSSMRAFSARRGPPVQSLGGAAGITKMSLKCAIVEQQALRDQTLRILRRIHRHAKRWLQWWHHTDSRPDNNAWIARPILELSFRAIEALWESLRRWMGQVYMGLHDLEMWECRSDGGNVQHIIHEMHMGVTQLPASISGTLPPMP